LDEGIIHPLFLASQQQKMAQFVGRNGSHDLCTFRFFVPEGGEFSEPVQAQKCKICKDRERNTIFAVFERGLKQSALSGTRSVSEPS
jgi:hypothetical protein